MSTGFKVWVAFCLALGLAMAGLVAWAIVEIVNKVAG